VACWCCPLSGRKRRARKGQLHQIERTSAPRQKPSATAPEVALYRARGISVKSDRALGPNSPPVGARSNHHSHVRRSIAGRPEAAPGAPRSVQSATRPARDPAQIQSAGRKASGPRKSRCSFSWRRARCWCAKTTGRVCWPWHGREHDHFMQSRHRYAPRRRPCHFGPCALAARRTNGARGSRSRRRESNTRLKGRHGNWQRWILCWRPELDIRANCYD